MKAQLDALDCQSSSSDIEPSAPAHLAQQLEDLGSELASISDDASVASAMRLQLANIDHDVSSVVSTQHDDMDVDSAATARSEHEGDIVAPVQVRSPLEAIALSQSALSEADLDQTTMDAARHLLSHKHTFTSTTAEAEQLGMHRVQLRALKVMASALLLQFNRFMWERLESSVTDRAGANFHVFLQFCSYDGVELILRDEGATVDTRPDLPMVAALLDDEAPDDFLKEEVFEGENAQASVQKILNSFAANAMLIELNGKFFAVRGDMVHCLMTSDRTTSECMLAMLIKFGQKTNACREQFAVKVRVCGPSIYVISSKVL